MGGGGGGGLWGCGAVRITSWNPKFNGSHFGLPSSSNHRMTGLDGNIRVNYDVITQAPYFVQKRQKVNRFLVGARAFNSSG